MSMQGKIHHQIIATGNEWKPCIECKERFNPGEILTAIDTESNQGVVYWYCKECTERLFGHLLAESWRQTWVLTRADGVQEPVDLNAARYGNAGS